MVSTDVKTMSSSNARSQSVISEINEKILHNPIDLKEINHFVSQIADESGHKLLNGDYEEHEMSAPPEQLAEVVSSSSPLSGLASTEINKETCLVNSAQEIHSEQQAYKEEQSQDINLGNGFHHINGFTEDLGENVEVDCSPDYKKDAQFTLEKQPNLSDLSSDVQNSSDRLNYEIDSLLSAK